jgi:hypothetical protein
LPALLLATLMEGEFNAAATVMRMQLCSVLL